MNIKNIVRIVQKEHRILPRGEVCGFIKNRYQRRYINSNIIILFAAEMAQAYKDQVIKWGIEEIIPIPLHKSRKRKRGYNQAEIIAKCLSEKTGVSLVSDALFRVKKTTAQKKLDRQERMGNLRDAFALSERWKPVANVLLIDDIYTTGATVEQAAKILKKAGAQNVYFLTISIGQGI